METTYSTVLLITDDGTGRYSFTSDAGKSVDEMAFGIAALAKALVRDGYIKKTDDFTKAIKKYINDPQYSEVKENKENKDV